MAIYKKCEEEKTNCLDINSWADRPGSGRRNTGTPNECNEDFKGTWYEGQNDWKHCEKISDGKYEWKNSIPPRRVHWDLIDPNSVGGGAGSSTFNPINLGQASTYNQLTYEEWNQNWPMEFGTSSDEIAQLQKRLSSASDAFDKLLRQGTTQSNLTEINYAVDRRYGPRTELAIQAALQLVPSVNGTISPKQKETEFKTLTEKDYGKIMSIDTDKLGALSAATIDVAAENIKRRFNLPDSAFAESVSYKKDLLNPTKNRYKKLQNLVFERLVKGCK